LSEFNSTFDFFEKFRNNEDLVPGVFVHDIVAFVSMHALFFSSMEMLVVGGTVVSFIRTWGGR